MYYGRFTICVARVLVPGPEILIIPIPPIPIGVAIAAIRSRSKLIDGCLTSGFRLL